MNKRGLTILLFMYFISLTLFVLLSQVFFRIEVFGRIIYLPGVMDILTETVILYSIIIILYIIYLRLEDMRVNRKLRAIRNDQPLKRVWYDYIFTYQTKVIYIVIVGFISFYPVLKYGLLYRQVMTYVNEFIQKEIEQGYEPTNPFEILIPGYDKKR